MRSIARCGRQHTALPVFADAAVDLSFGNPWPAPARGLEHIRHSGEYYALKTLSPFAQ